MLWGLGPRVRGKTWVFGFGASGLDIRVAALAKMGLKGTLRSPSGSALHYWQRISLQTKKVLSFPPGRGTAHVRAERLSAYRWGILRSGTLGWFVGSPSPTVGR
eukprot:1222862-Rhodomonas_salina.1